MSLLLKQIYAFFKMLNSETGTNQIASGLAFGFVLGFSPILSLQGILVILLCLFLRIQMGAAFLAAFFFKFIAFLFDPLTDSLGRKILEEPSFIPLFVKLYNMPLVPLTRFNNSIVMGSAVVTFILVIPLFFIFRILIQKYRVHVVQRMKETKLWKALSATGLYKWYAKYEELYR